MGILKLPFAFVLQGDKCKFSHDTTPATKSVVRYWFFTNVCRFSSSNLFFHKLILPNFGMV